MPPESGTQRRPAPRAPKPGTEEVHGAVFHPRCQHLSHLIATQPLPFPTRHSPLRSVTTALRRPAPQTASSLWMHRGHRLVRCSTGHVLTGTLCTCPPPLSLLLHILPPAAPPGRGRWHGMGSILAMRQRRLMLMMRVVWV